MAFTVRQNKSSYERGFAHASIYKNVQVKVRGDKTMRGDADDDDEYFGNVMPKGAPGRVSGWVSGCR